jgi:cytochrome c553
MRSTALFIGVCVLTWSAGAQAADIQAGKTLAVGVCAACHGATGISVSDTVPNLAGQRARYVEAQLKFFKDGTRKEAGAVSRAAIMNAVAAQLSADDIANVAAYFEAQSGPTSNTKSALVADIATSHVTFPEGYKDSFVKYHTIDFPAAKEVRYYYANRVAVDAAKNGKTLPDGSVLFAEVNAAKLDDNKNPIKGPDGHFVPNNVTGYTAMEREAGWGAKIPEILRNENWNYAVFTNTKQHRPGINQAECLACHKPLSNVSYTFTLEQLKKAP